MCHSLISYPGVCPLDVYVSFPGMMQDDKGNIKVNFRDHTGIAINWHLSWYWYILPLHQHGIIQHPYWV